LDFFLVLLKLQGGLGGPKNDEIWHNFRPSPQTFCSHARTRQNIVILKKKLLSTDGCSTRVPGLVKFGLYKPLRSTRHIIVFFRNLAWDMFYLHSRDGSTTTSELRRIKKKQLHCCPRLNVRVHSSKVELAAAGVHPVGMISSHASV